jgi:hypothetical protein
MMDRLEIVRLVDRRSAPTSDAQDILIMSARLSDWIQTGLERELATVDCKAGCSADESRSRYSTGFDGCSQT